MFPFICVVLTAAHLSCQHFIPYFNWMFECVSRTRNLTLQWGRGGIVFFCLPHDRAQIEYKSVPGRFPSPGQYSIVKGWISKRPATDPVRRPAIIPDFRSMNGSARSFSFGHCNCRQGPVSCPPHYVYISPRMQT